MKTNFHSHLALVAEELADYAAAIDPLGRTKKELLSAATDYLLFCYAKRISQGELVIGLHSETADEETP